jgi:hypothetical protein
MTPEEALTCMDKTLLTEWLTAHGYGFNMFLKNARVNNLKALVWVICEREYPNIFKD